MFQIANLYAWNVINNSELNGDTEGGFMKKVLSLLGMLLLFGIIWVGCSEDKNPLPSKSHPEGWAEPGAKNFHGDVVAEIGYESCTNCHGLDLHGGKSKTSCFKCHEAYPHMEGWDDSLSANFHGEFLRKADFSLKSCQKCHGEDNKGGTSDVSCFKCHKTYPHSEEWLNQESNSFHGKYVEAANWSVQECQSCHGSNFGGGSTGVSCYKCHDAFPHKSGWVDVSSANFHGQNIRAAHWSMAECKACHGDDYRGGKVGVSCYLCHTSEGGPEACNVCHGSANNAAPPKDLSGNLETSAIGVGAHQKHLALFGSCSVCHIMPSSFSDSTHIDNTPHAEVLASWGWDRNTATCANACHSDPTKSYIWNNF